MAIGGSILLGPGYGPPARGPLADGGPAGVVRTAIAIDTGATFTYGRLYVSSHSAEVLTMDRVRALTGSHGVTLVDAYFVDTRLSRVGIGLESGTIDGGAAAQRVPAKIQPGGLVEVVVVFRVEGTGDDELRGLSIDYHDAGKHYVARFENHLVRACTPRTEPCPVPTVVSG